MLKLNYNMTRLVRSVYKGNKPPDEVAPVILMNVVMMFREAGPINEAQQKIYDEVLKVLAERGYPL